MSTNNIIWMQVVLQIEWYDSVAPHIIQIIDFQFDLNFSYIFLGPFIFADILDFKNLQVKS